MISKTDELIRKSVHGLYTDSANIERRWFHQQTFVKFNSEQPYNQMSQRLLSHRSDLENRRNFHEIYTFIKAHSELINPFGVLSVYDTTLRMSQNRHFNYQPVYVYIHRGAERDYKTLFNTDKLSDYVEKKEFKAISFELSKLESKYLEDILCIYKKTFWKLINK